MTHLYLPLTHLRRQTPWRLATGLVSGRIMPGFLWQFTGYRFKFLLRSALHLRTTRTLLNALVQHPLLPEMMRAQPNLPCKLHRPYLAVNLGTQQALQALCDHYQLINHAMPEAMRLGYLDHQPYPLAEVEGKEGERYTLALSAIGKLDKEGEATLLFSQQDGTVLAEITFTLMHYQGQPTLFIGGLQGAHRKLGHDAIQLATKACQGLFPKRLAVQALCRLASQLGMTQILAVGNQTHIYQSWRYNKKKQGQLHADYDSFWRSLGAEQQAEGYFSLPLTPTRKSMEEIASKKRAEYRRRYALLDGIDAGVDHRFPAR